MVKLSNLNMEVGTDLLSEMDSLSIYGGDWTDGSDAENYYCPVKEKCKCTCCGSCLSVIDTYL